MSGRDAWPTAAQVLEQEARLTLQSCSEADALAIGQWLLAAAEARSLAVTVEAWHGDRLVFRAARPGTNAHNDLYLAGKRAVVRHFGHASFYERLRHEEAGTSFEEATSLAFPAYAPHGGGFPLIVAGTGMVGVVLVSGLPQEQDHALIVEALEAFLARRAG
jgi:uncharacterized protein (UPF0303 family)